VVEKADLEA